MKLYEYNNDTKEFTFESTAQIDPISKEHLLRVNATTIEPIKTKKGFAIVFNEDLQNWEYTEDNRDKTVYNKETKEELKVDYLGKIKDEHTLLVPSEFDKWDSKTKKWVCDNDAVAIKNEADAKITRDNAEIANIEVFGVEWQVGDKDQSRMEKTIDTATRNNYPAQTTIGWILADNSIRQTTVKDLSDVLDAVNFRTQDIFTQYSIWRATDRSKPFVYPVAGDD